MSHRTGHATLNEQTVALIKARLKQGVSARQLAQVNEVGLETIRRIGRGDTWAWVEAVGTDSVEWQAEKELGIAVERDDEGARLALERFHQLINATGESKEPPVRPEVNERASGFGARDDEEDKLTD
jgi:hypothetical protein